MRLEGVRGGWTLCGYDTGLGAAVRRAKVSGDRGLMTCLGELMAARLGAYVEPGVFTALVPAPSTAWTRWQRGFSSASVLADLLARRTGVPRVECLVRRTGTRQVGLGRAGRRTNLAGRLSAEGEVSGRVLVIDDVLTTGATATACARELLCVGATEVWVATLCVARAEERRSR